MPERLRVALAAAALFALICAAPAGARVESIAPAARHGRTLVFDLARFRPEEVRAAHLEVGRHRQNLDIGRVRAEAGHGMLRVRMSRSLRRSLARHRRQRSGPALVLLLRTVPANASPVPLPVSGAISGPAGPADAVAPTAPANLKASTTQTSASLSWTAASDNTGVAGYDVYAGTRRTGSTPLTSFTVSGLACGTPLTLAVDAYDAAGNRSPTASIQVTTRACGRPAHRYAVRGMYERDSSATGFDYEAAIGFNFIDSGPYASEMDELGARGLKGLVWLGGYSNTTCAFNQTDDWVRSHLVNIAGNPGVGAYFIDDEPDATTCPNAPAQMKARSDLVKSIDPGPPTLMVDYKVSQFAKWAGKTDILGLDHYPCTINDGCRYSYIDEQAAEADRLGIRYWGVIQAVGDGSYYRPPTPGEMHQQFVHWRATHMEGYLVYSWKYPADGSALRLADNPALQAQLLLENAG